MSNTKTVMGQASNQYVKPLDITDVFSTYLYEGKGAAGPSGGQTITNGIDLAGEGGLVWIKSRNNAYDHRLTDTERGIRKSIETQSTEAEADTVHCVSGSFNSDGFSIGDTGTPSAVNTFGDDYASWTFRKAPKFFDVVTWTGDGSNNRQISHNLGTTVGCMIVKRTDVIKNWRVYHRAAAASPENGYLTLNSSADWYDELVEGGRSQDASKWWYTAPTATDFTVSSNVDVNASGGTYVAYLFAHNDGDGGFGPTGDQDIIKCGSYTGNGSTTGPEIDLGFEPQWLLIKNASGVSNWLMVDNMRGFPVGSDNGRLFSNLTNAEVSFNGADPTATGFKLVNSTGGYNTSGNSYIYMAIRRGPLAQPESGTEVFDVSTRNASEPAYTSGFPVDFAFARAKNIANNWDTGSRLQQGNRMFTNLTNAEATNSNMMFDYQEGWSAGTGASTDYLSWMWKRAPGFCDVVAYTGDGTSGSYTHNLGVIPELKIIKNRGGQFWVVGGSAVTGGTATGYLVLNTNAAKVVTVGEDYWGSLDSDTTFSVRAGNGASNLANANFIAYLFATVPGVSKVGSYTGNDSSQTIDCGFTSGARFILIKKAIGGIGNWYIFDSVRGIIAGNDPNLRLDNTGAEQALADIVDPHNSGFIVNSAGGLNASGSTYIFYAIA
jgi:hypothetical protein